MTTAFLFRALEGGGNSLALLGVAGAVGIFLAVYWMGQKFVLWPRKVAHRIRLLS